MYPGWAVEPVSKNRNPFYRTAIWKPTFSWLPKRCALSNKLIWLRRGLLGTAVWKGPGEDAIEHRWHDIDEHLIWKLKGN